MLRLKMSQVRKDGREVRFVAHRRDIRVGNLTGGHMPPDCCDANRTSNILQFSVEVLVTFRVRRSFWVIDNQYDSSLQTAKPPDKPCDESKSFMRCLDTRGAIINP